MLVTAIVTVIAAYFIRSINFAVIFAKAFLKKEADFSRAFGSGVTVTGHLILQSAILIYLALILN